MARVFEHADRFYKLLGVLARPSRKGELSEDVKGRNGIPLVRLISHELEDLGKGTRHGRMICCEI